MAILIEVFVVFLNLSSECWNDTTDYDMTITFHILSSSLFAVILQFWHYIAHAAEKYN
jgi:hypothetical protein